MQVTAVSPIFRYILKIPLQEVQNEANPSVMSLPKKTDVLPVS